MMNNELENDATGKMEIMEIGFLLEEKSKVTTGQEEFQSQKTNTFSVSKGQKKMKRAYKNAGEIPVGLNEDLQDCKGIKH